MGAATVLLIEAATPREDLTLVQSYPLLIRTTHHKIHWVVFSTRFDHRVKNISLPKNEEAPGFFTDVEDIDLSSADMSLVRVDEVD